MKLVGWESFNTEDLLDVDTRHVVNHESVNSRIQRKQKIKKDRRLNPNSKHLGVIISSLNNKDIQNDEILGFNSENDMVDPQSLPKGRTTIGRGYDKTKLSLRRNKVNKGYKRVLEHNKVLGESQISLMHLNPQKYFAENLYSANNYKNIFLQYQLKNSNPPNEYHSYDDGETFLLSDQIKLPIYVGFFASGFIGVIIILLLSLWISSGIRSLIYGNKSHEYEDYSSYVFNKDEGKTLAEVRAMNPNLTKIDDFVSGCEFETPKAENDKDYVPQDYTEDNQEPEEPKSIVESIYNAFVPVKSDKKDDEESQSLLGAVDYDRYIESNENDSDDKCVIDEEGNSINRLDTDKLFS